VIEQGDIWLLEEPEAPPRPCLVLSRGQAIPVLSALIVAPLTRAIRGIPTEVRFGPDDGLPFDSVASFDNVVTVSRAHLTQHLARVDTRRWNEVCEAMRIAVGC
jgi:mRNA interferase MazF